MIRCLIIDNSTCKGFTLVELVLAIALSGVIATIGLQTLSFSRNQLKQVTEDGQKSLQTLVLGTSITDIITKVLESGEFDLAMIDSMHIEVKRAMDADSLQLWWLLNQYNRDSLIAIDQIHLYQLFESLSKTDKSNLYIHSLCMRFSIISPVGEIWRYRYWDSPSIKRIKVAQVLDAQE